MKRRVRKINTIDSNNSVGPIYLNPNVRHLKTYEYANKSSKSRNNHS